MLHVLVTECTEFKQNQTSSPFCWTALIMLEDGVSVAGSEFSLIILRSCGPRVQQYNTDKMTTLV